MIAARRLLRRAGRSAVGLAPASSLLLSLVCSVVLSLAPGCRTPAGPAEEVPAPKVEHAPITGTLRDALNRLLPADAWPGAFVIQHRVRIRFPSPDGPREEAFDAALQRGGDALLLVGFGPMQQVGFVLRLQGGEVTFTNRTGREMPFRPEDILADVQRVYYPWPDDPVVCAACDPPLAVAVAERREAGRLVERRFRAVGRPALGEVVVDYSGAPFFGDVTTHVRVRNDWFGYELFIDNQRVEPIE